MTDENKIDSTLLDEIFPTPSQTLRSSEADEAAPCSGICSGGTCHGA